MTPRHRPIVCESDFLRIEHLLEDLSAVSIADIHDIEALRTKIGKARVVADDALPRSAVCLGSRFVLIDEESKVREWYCLVDPGEANIASGKLSVLAPLGTAILGNRANMIVSFLVRNGTRKLRIGRILQEELSTRRSLQLFTCDDTVTPA